MIVIAGRMSIDPAKRDEAAAAARTVGAATKAEAGCEAYEFSFDIDDPATIHIFERWASQEALDQHFQTPHLAAFGQALGSLGVHATDVRQYQIDSWKSLSGG